MSKRLMDKVNGAESAETTSDPNEAETPTSTTTGTAPETAPLPGWNSPPPQLQDEPDPRATTGPDDGPGSSSGEQSSPASTDGPSAKDVLKAHRGRVELAGQLIGGVLLAAAGVLNQRMAVDENDDAWLMTEAEVEGMATPLARVAARRVPLPDGSSQASDIADLVSAGITGIAYAIRNLQTSAARRRARESTPTFPADVEPDGAHVDPAPAPEPAPAPAPAAVTLDPVDALRFNGAVGGAVG